MLVGIVGSIGITGAGCASGSSYYVPSPTNFAGEESVGGYASDGEVASTESIDAVASSAMVSADYDEGPMPVAAQASSSRSSRRDRVAVNAPPPQAVTGATTTATGPAPTVAVDAPALRDLIIYTANITLAIYEVDATQRAIVAVANELGGFIANLDQQSLIIRIPAAKFDEFLTRVEAQGRVLGRQIQADDVTEQFRDLQIRIENLSAMRQRLEAMLARAANVQEAIQVEHELERVTVELEALRGRLRFLADRVSYSTVTIRFQPLPREQLAGNVPLELPVSWLRTLGLSNLMR